MTIDHLRNMTMGVVAAASMMLFAPSANACDDKVMEFHATYATPVTTTRVVTSPVVVTRPITMERVVSSPVVVTDMFDDDDGLINVRTPLLNFSLF